MPNLPFGYFCSAWPVPPPHWRNRSREAPPGLIEGIGKTLARTTRVQFRPLTPDEGLAILGAALDSRHHPVSTADCSHLVHALYERAGFHYAYAPSWDLYLGIDEFQRVTNPQPGDLAVWRGHAGIVVNPVQHSFFSLLNSGPGVDSYDAPYWKQRGRPHFFRYVKAAPSVALSGSLRTASLNPTTLNDDVGPHQPAAKDTVPDASEASSSETRSSTRLTTNHLATEQAVNKTIPGVPVCSSGAFQSSQARSGGSSFPASLHGLGRKPACAGSLQVGSTSNCVRPLRGQQSAHRGKPGLGGGSDR